VLSYVTHYNAVNANIGINETFLETAQSRGSIVGHARQLSYTPKSATGAVASVSIQVNNPNNNVLTINKGHRFSSIIDNVTYTFVTTESYNTEDAFFVDVEITQGETKSTEYIFDVNTSEKFIIPEVNVDTSTIEVNIYDSVGSTSYTTFVLAKDINQITATSPVYYLNESFDGRYEITFGDGVLGQALVNGNLIEIKYLITEGPDANGAVAFSSVDNIEGNTNLTITTNAISIGGLPKESLKSIKYNAPLSFAAQNRAVTPDDYKAVILENFDNANSIVVWGGEDNDPPQYGRAYVSIIPRIGETLSTQERDQVINEILRPKCVVSVTPELVDPEYTYVALEVFYKRNSSESTLSFAQITSSVRSAISTYNDQQLRKFDGVLRYSSLLNVIDTAEKSIINSSVRVYMKKRFVPVIGQSKKYELQFSSPIYDAGSNKQVIYKSSIFTVNGEQCSFQDYLDSTGQRRIRIVRGSGVNQITIVDNVGRIDALAGKIIIDNFNPSAFIGSYIELTIIPNSNDIAPKRNNIVAIDINDTVISGAGDPISTGSAAGGLSYDSIPRHA